jgi:chromosome segregation ATPase
MRAEGDKVSQYQSAYLSNQKAFNEKMEELSAEVRAKTEELRAQQEQSRELVVQCERLKEEVNAYKGRCANLQRDVQVSQGYLEKVSSDSAG